MAGMMDAIGTPQYCGHCGMMHAGPCPRIKAIEYYPNGTMKRVEYHPPAPVITGSPLGEPIGFLIGV